uniref:Uncharacterized protein n=1 Tax=Timspurckia oligopyrenoides TaxID=708627 RepID=A0A7S0ZHA7_9RHOD|mmetsp:Transcript_4939/g.8578  ORF Transcript_4939/g.8578 Transcript_4939/m.8578 type:complete len:135 (+) Transcript_4939:55-459(+)
MTTEDTGALVRSAHAQKLDEIIRSIANSYRDIVKASGIETRVIDSCSNFRVEVEALNLTKGCEDLLEFISELKTIVLTNDSKSAAQESSEFEQQVKLKSEKTDLMISHLISKVEHILTKLERIETLPLSNKRTD